MKRVYIFLISFSFFTTFSCLALSQFLYKETTIVDNQTNLEWTKVASGPLMPNAAARFCQNQVFMDFNDWRLPSIYELRQFYENLSKTESEKSTENFSLEKNSFWTSTIIDFDNPWRLYIQFGQVPDPDNPRLHQALCVRSYSK